MHHSSTQARLLVMVVTIAYLFESVTGTQLVPEAQGDNEPHLFRRQAPAATPLRIVFIGNSYTYGPGESCCNVGVVTPNMDYCCVVNMFIAIAQAAGKSVNVTMFASAGKTLQGNYASAEARAAVSVSDFAVLQEQSTMAETYPDLYVPAATSFGYWLKTGAKAILYNPWPRRLDYYANRCSQQLTVKKISASHYWGVKAIGDGKAAIAANGIAILAATVRGLATDDELWQSDGQHSTSVSNYLNAVSIFLSMFKEEPPLYVPSDSNIFNLARVQVLRSLVMNIVCPPPTYRCNFGDHVYDFQFPYSVEYTTCSQNSVSQWVSAYQSKAGIWTSQTGPANYVAPFAPWHTMTTSTTTTTTTTTTTSTTLTVTTTTSTSITTTSSTSTTSTSTTRTSSSSSTSTSTTTSGTTSKTPSFALSTTSQASSPPTGSASLGIPQTTLIRTLSRKSTFLAVSPVGTTTPLPPPIGPPTGAVDFLTNAVIIAVSVIAGAGALVILGMALVAYRLKRAKANMARKNAYAVGGTLGRVPTTVPTTVPTYMNIAAPNYNMNMMPSHSPMTAMYAMPTGQTAALQAYMTYSTAGGYATAPDPRFYPPQLTMNYANGTREPEVSRDNGTSGMSGVALIPASGYGYAAPPPADPVLAGYTGMQSNTEDANVEQEEEEEEEERDVQEERKANVAPNVQEQVVHEEGELE